MLLGSHIPHSFPFLRPRPCIFILWIYFFRNFLDSWQFLQLFLSLLSSLLISQWGFTSTSITEDYESIIYFVTHSQIQPQTNREFPCEILIHIYIFSCRKIIPKFLLAPMSVGESSHSSLQLLGCCWREGKVLTPCLSSPLHFFHPDSISFISTSSIPAPSPLSPVFISISPIYFHLLHPLSISFNPSPSPSSL